MDKVDQNTENKFKILQKKFERKMVTESLDTTPHTLPDDPSGKFIEFGNTGLILSNETFDFVPEHRVGRDEAQMAKHALMLSSAFSRVYDFLNDSSDIYPFKAIDCLRIDKVSTRTNRVLINAVEKLFNRSNVKGLATHDDIRDDDGLLEIDLKRFKNLSDTDPLIVYLKRVSERAKNITVHYMKTISL